MEIGYTRDHDNPNADNKGDPIAGQVAQFFYEDKIKKDIDGNPVLGPDGKEILTQVLCVKVTSATDPRAVFIGKATPQIKAQYRRFWEAFQRQEDATKVMGTPLDNLQGLDVLQSHQLQGMGFFSIEALAEADEGVVLQHPVVRHWKTKAMAHVKRHKPRPDQQALDEIALLRAELERMKRAQDREQPAIVEAVSVEEKARRDAERNAQAAMKPDNPGKIRRKAQPADEATAEEAA